MASRSRTAGPELLVQAIHAAARGDALIALIALSITVRLLETFARTHAVVPSQPLDPLTAREEEVLLTAAKGHTNAEVCDELHLSMSTVKTHIGSLMTKIGARNRVEIVIWAYETGRIPG